MNLYDALTHEQIGLPRLLEDFLHNEWYVLNVDNSSGDGKSGKVRASKPGETGPRSLYPGVFGCYIADAPRDNGATKGPFS